MTVFNNSRYRSATITEVTLASGERRPYLYNRRAGLGRPTPNSVQETYTASEALDFMAFRFLGEETLWWVIADMNNLLFPEVDSGITPDVNALFVGRRLTIPPLTRG